MAKVKFEDMNDPKKKIGFMVFECIRHQICDIVKDVEENNGNTEECDVEIKVNGIDIDVEKAMENLYDLMEANINDTAKEIVETLLMDKISAIEDKLNSIRLQAEEIVEDKIWDEVHDRFWEIKFGKKKN